MSLLEGTGQLDGCQTTVYVARIDSDNGPLLIAALRSEMERPEGAINTSGPDTIPWQGMGSLTCDINDLTAFLRERKLAHDYPTIIFSRLFRSPAALIPSFFWTDTRASHFESLWVTFPAACGV